MAPLGRGCAPVLRWDRVVGREGTRASPAGGPSLWTLGDRLFPGWGCRGAWCRWLQASLCRHETQPPSPSPQPQRSQTQLRASAAPTPRQDLGPRCLAHRRPCGATPCIPSPRPGLLSHPSAAVQGPASPRHPSPPAGVLDPQAHPGPWQAYTAPAKPEAAGVRPWGPQGPASFRWGTGLVSWTWRVWDRAGWCPGLGQPEWPLRTELWQPLTLG